MLLTTLPMTAMPTAPPTSRVVSLTAEPTPALFIGTLCTMPLLSDGVDEATP